MILAVIAVATACTWRIDPIDPEWLVQTIRVDLGTYERDLARCVEMLGDEAECRRLVDRAVQIRTTRVRRDW